MALTDATLRQAKDKPDKTHKMYDEKGLYLLVTKAGGKYWRLNYRFSGKEKTLALSVYPEGRLKQARLGRDKARELLANGVDPKTKYGEQRGWQRCSSVKLNKEKSLY